MNLTGLFSNSDSRLQLPKVNAVQRFSGDDSPWTPEQVRGVISNPCYAGIGPYPPLVPEDAWIHTAARTIADEGSRTVSGKDAGDASPVIRALCQGHPQKRVGNQA